MEETLIIIKPDSIKKRIAGKILNRFEKTDLNIKDLGYVLLTRSFVEKFYPHLNDIHPKMLNSIYDFMTSSPVIYAVLKGENAISKARELCGPTDPAKAPKGTIRGDFGTESMEERIKKLEATPNIIHSSKNKEEADREIGLMYKFVYRR